AGEPEVLLLDEPTAGVDIAHQRALAASLHQLTLRGATIVLVAHELGPLEPLVSRAVVMRDGRIVQDGPPLGDHGEGHAHHVHEPDLEDGRSLNLSSPLEQTPTTGGAP